MSEQPWPPAAYGPARPHAGPHTCPPAYPTQQHYPPRYPTAQPFPPPQQPFPPPFPQGPYPLDPAPYGYPYPQPYRYPPPPRSGNGGLIGGLVTAAVVVLLLISVLAVVVRREAVAFVARGAAPPVAPAAAPQAGADGKRGEISDRSLQSLLDNHGKGLREGNEKAFLAAYDPAVRALVAQQRTLFANLRKIPFTTTSFSLSEQGPDLAPGPAVSMDADVYFVHQITGVDLGQVYEGYRWRITRKAPNAPLLVSAVGGTPARSSHAKYLYYPAPWDQLPLTVIRKKHVVLLANDQTSALATRWADTAEQSAAQDLRGWGTRPGGAPGFLVMFENRRSRFYAYWDGNETGTSWEAAYTMSLPGYSATGVLERSVGSRIVSYTGSSFFAPGHDPGYLFSHEMAHALVAPLGPKGGADTPLYIVEGFARFMETRHRSVRPFLRDPALRAYLQKGFTGHLPTDADLRSDNDDVAGAGYELSLLVYLFIEHKLGAAHCYDLVTRAYLAPTADGGRAALSRATGMTVADFETEWVAYVHSRVG